MNIYIYIYILPAFQIENSNHEKQITLLMIPNGGGWNYLAVKKLSAILEYQNMVKIFFVLIVFIHLEQKTNLNCMEKYLKIKIFMML